MNKVQTHTQDNLVSSKSMDLTKEMVKEHLCPNATDSEIFMFLKLCQYQKLNPFLREVYLIKYGSHKAQIVTGKEAFLKRAARNPKYRGHKAWTEGSGKDLFAIAEVYVDGFQCPILVTVHYDEYASTGNPIWKSKPKTMLRKVALVQALREAFPDDLGGLYDQSEINTIPGELPSEPIQFDKHIEKVNAINIIQEKEIKISDWKDEVIPFGKNNGTRLGYLPEKELLWYAKEWKSGKSSSKYPRLCYALSIALEDISDPDIGNCDGVEDNFVSEE